jgi:hypothetical protein
MVAEADVDAAGDPAVSEKRFDDVRKQGKLQKSDWEQGQEPGEVFAGASQKMPRRR